MYVSNPKRLGLFMLLVVAVLVAIYFLLLSGGVVSSPISEPVITKPLPAPTAVADAIKATAAQPRVIVKESTPATTGVSGQVVDHYIDAAAGFSYYIINGKLSFLSKGDSSWVAGPGKAGCYVYTLQHSAAQSPNFAQQFLPFGTSETQYTYPNSSSIMWKEVVPNGGAITEHGDVSINAATSVIQSASIYEGTRVVSHATFSYPATLNAPATPTKICKPVVRAPGESLPRAVKKP